VSTCSTANDQALFWCMGTLVHHLPRRFPTMPDPDRDAFCDMLGVWLSTVLVAQPVPLFLRNKACQLVVVAFELQWPARWESFWPMVFGLLPRSVQMIDVFLRILDTIDERIVSRDYVVDRQRSATIKNAMRDRCVGDIVNAWYNILGGFHKERPEIAQRCLQCMQNYIEWIDIQLVTSEQWVNLLFYLFTLEQLREDACDCLFEIISKRMDDPARKLGLLRRLNVCGVLPGIAAVVVKAVERDGEDYADEGFGLKVARLAMTVGMELLDIAEKAEGQVAHPATAPAARNPAAEVARDAMVLLEECLAALFSLFGVPHTAISTSMLDFITQYVAKLKREPTLTERHNAHLLSLLAIVARGLEYTDRYDFAKPCSDYESQVAEHRKSLFTVVRNLAVKSPLVAQFVTRRLVETLANLHSPACRWAQVEAALALVFTLGEGATGDAFADAEGPLAVCMRAVATGDASRFPHQAVQIMFFENCERYHLFFALNRELLPGTLAAFLDDRGICNPNEQVTYRAAYLFKNFVQPLKAHVAPLVAELYPALQAALARGTGPETGTKQHSGLGTDERLNLYEALGLLLGSEALPYAGAVQYLEAAAAPLLGPLEVAVSSGALAATTQSGRRAAEGAADRVACLAYLTKGFNGTTLPLLVPNPTPTKERGDLSGVFMKLLGAVLAVFESGKQQPPVRDKTLLFIHRMIDLLGERLAPYIPKLTLALLETATVADASKAMRIPTQFVKRARTGAVPPVSELFIPLVQRVFELTGVDAIRKQNSVVSEEVRQHAELMRSYYNFVFALLTPKCSEVFTCPQNRPHLDNVLTTVLQGCMTHPELDLAKCCFQILTEMVSIWRGVDGFGQAAQTRVLPASFDAILLPHFDPRDAKANTVLLEVATLHKTMLEAYGPPFALAVQGIVGGLVSDAGAAQQYVLQLQAAPAKGYKNCLRDLILLLRRRDDGPR